MQLFLTRVRKYLGIRYHSFPAWNLVLTLSFLVTPLHVLLHSPSFSFSLHSTPTYTFRTRRSHVKFIGSSSIHLHYHTHQSSFIRRYPPTHLQRTASSTWGQRLYQRVNFRVYKKKSILHRNWRENGNYNVEISIAITNMAKLCPYLSR